MKTMTLWGEEELDIQSKMCIECREVLPFTSFGYRNKTVKKPELLNTCKKCKATHDRYKELRVQMNAFYEKQIKKFERLICYENNDTMG